MNDAEILTRKLFESQPLYLIPDDTEAYKLKGQLQNVNAELVIVSLLKDVDALVTQKEIFERMLSRLPNQNLSTQIVYTQQTELQLSWLRALSERNPSEVTAKHVLTCGLELKNNDVVFPLNKNISRDQLQILPTDEITFIDTDPTLKKKMWSEWMKQFGK